MIIIKDLKVIYLKKNIHHKFLKNSLIIFFKNFFLKTKRQNDYFTALDIRHLEFKKGDKVGLVGRNGSGKTTFLNFLANRIPSSVKKTVYINNNDIAHFIDLKEGFDAMGTGYENTIIKLIMNDIPVTNKIIKSIHNFSELGQFFYQPISTYSSGMVMRLAFSIMINVKKNVILMDEWLSVGDSDFKLKANKELKKILKCTDYLFLATHSSELVNKICNRVITLEKGKVISDKRLDN